MYYLLLLHSNNGRTNACVVTVARDWHFSLADTMTPVSSGYAPHVNHYLGVNESHLGCHGYHFCCVLCEVRLEAEEKVEHRAYST
jgi:hypothetical protein